MSEKSNIEAEAEQWAFEAFAQAHPHECYATWPERFWQFFHAKCPAMPREKMEALLKQTDEPETP